MRLQVGFVNKVHNNSMRKPAMVHTAVFSHRDSNDTWDQLLKCANMLKESREFFIGGRSFGLKQDDMRNHFKRFPSFFLLVILTYRAANTEAIRHFAIIIGPGFAFFNLRQGSNERDSSSSPERSRPVILRCAQDDRVRLFKLSRTLLQH